MELLVIWDTIKLMRRHCNEWIPFGFIIIDWCLLIRKLTLKINDAIYSFILSKTSFETGITVINKAARTPLIAICKMLQLPHDLWHAQWQNVRVVAKALNVNASTISRLRRQFEELGMTTNHPHAWCPPVTTTAQDRYIRMLHLRNRLRPATTTADETVGLLNRRISPQTVRNRLREANHCGRRPRRGLHLTPAWRRQRTAWIRKAHRLDASAMEECPVQWWVTFPVSTEQTGGSVWGAAQGSGMLTSPSQVGTRLGRRTGLGGNIPWTLHTTACRCR